MATILKLFGFFAALVLVGIGIWKTQFESPEKLVVFERYPTGIMGTTCHLAVVMDFREGELANKILDKAEYQIRYVESLASNWIANSEISRFNDAEADTSYEFSMVNASIIKAGYEYFQQTDGAFDMTCRPLIRLWKQAGKVGVLPSESEIETQKKQSSWDLIEFGEGTSLLKMSSNVRLDLGGIAKGYAIDLAVEVMQTLSVVGGLVDIGGDIRVYGSSARADKTWHVDVKDPFQKGNMRQLRLSNDEAVCTSGNYARYVEIEGKRYSHIVNPQTGYPTEEVPSVTVIANDTVAADVWATALSVLGPDGMALLPVGVEALLLLDKDGVVQVFETDGFPVDIKTWMIE